MECKLDGITLYYEIAGKGKPLFMLHGWPYDHTHMVFEMERHFIQRAGWQRIYLGFFAYRPKKVYYPKSCSTSRQRPVWKVIFGLVRLCAQGHVQAHAPTLERQGFIRVEPERAWRWGLTCWCVRSDLDFVSEQTTQLFFRTAGNRRKCGDIRSFITWAWSWAECQARDTDVVEGQVFGVN